jgi:hypothetical protein
MGFTLAARPGTVYKMIEDKPSRQEPLDKTRWCERGNGLIVTASRRPGRALLTPCKLLLPNSL